MDKSFEHYVDDGGEYLESGHSLEQMMRNLVNEASRQPSGEMFDLKTAGGNLALLTEGAHGAYASNHGGRVNDVFYWQYIVPATEGAFKRLPYCVRPSVSDIGISNETRDALLELRSFYLTDVREVRAKHGKLFGNVIKAVRRTAQLREMAVSDQVEELSKQAEEIKDRKRKFLDEFAAEESQLHDRARIIIAKSRDLQPQQKV